MSESSATTPAGEYSSLTSGVSVDAAPAGQSESDALIGQQKTIIGEGDEEHDNLPKFVINRLIALKNLQEESEKIEEQYKKERVALEKKFRDLKAPQWEKRQQIVACEVAVDSHVPEADVVVEGEEEAEEVDLGIPGFWLQCLQNHPNIGELISDDDAPALEALRDIKCEYNDDMSGFKLLFIFKENEYFTNAILSKSYTVSPDLLDEKAPALTNVEGTEIDWKPSKNLCTAEVRKKQRAKSGRRAGQVRYITTMTDKPSFFHYFKEPSMNAGEEDDDDEEEGAGGGAGGKKGSSKFTLGIDEDYEVGHAIRTAIIPEAVLWFTGEAAEDEDGDYDDDGEDDDDFQGDEDDEDEDDDDDDEEEEVSKPPPKGKKAKGWKGAGGPPAPASGSADKPECKQN